MPLIDAEIEQVIIETSQRGPIFRGGLHWAIHRALALNEQISVEPQFISEPLPAPKEKGQSKLMSLVEAITNIAIGAVIALASQLIIFPLYDVHLPLSQNIAITGWFTAVSVVRSYCLRRVFNRIKR